MTKDVAAAILSGRSGHINRDVVLVHVSPLLGSDEQEQGPNEAL